jgi:hypothetical protein
VVTGKEEAAMPGREEDDHMLSLKECADWLGVSLSTMRTLVKKEEIVAKKDRRVVASSTARSRKQ